ncbi:MAG TPA: hypothetical protein PKE16_07470, partial [Hyphomicrobium sp.]|nr:hypothetical protein [Hyphomicrobium sp.]
MPLTKCLALIALGLLMALGGQAKADGVVLTEPRLVLSGHTRDLWVAQFSPDGARILTASNDKTGKLWDAKTGAEVATL